MKKLIIIGAGGNCIDIVDIIHDINRVKGRKILGSLTSASQYSDCFFINGIGSPFNFWKKDKIISKTKIPLKRFITLIHPKAHVSSCAELGFGTIVFPNVTIMSNVKIGNHVIILSNSVINHDNRIGDYTCIASSVSISGSAEVGKLCYLGASSSLIGNISIGDYSLIGIGSVVLKNVPHNSVFAGNPAEFLRNTISD
jgi:sugar O-acyltransferase (sialic acid O-acetyltransferase NeuD family)